jgi:predicted transcriptional regulator
MKTTATDKEPWHTMRAAEFMKTPVVALNENITLLEAARLLSDEHIGGAPVVDHRGEPVGVISLFDIVSHLAGLERLVGEPGGFYRQGALSLEDTLEEGASTETPISEIMSPKIISVPPEATLGKVAQMLRDWQIHRVFVQDVAGKILGVVSTMDILRALPGKEE